MYKITFLFLLIPLLAFANNDPKKHEVSKVIHKEFTVNKNAEVKIDNKYGNITVATWDKNLVTIEVIITVKGNDLKSIKNQLEYINVQFQGTANRVSAETDIQKAESNWSFWKKNNSLNYKINYNIKMPKTNSVALENEYGNINLGTLLGKATIECDYGKISIGELYATNNSIDLEYCSSSTIGFMKGGSVDADYSKLTIETSEDIKIKADYSTLKLDKVGKINFNTDYGSIRINDANDVIGNSDYTGMHFGTIHKSLEIETEYGAVSVKRLAKDFKNVFIDGEYAGIRIGVDPGTVFDFEIDLQYASFRGDDDKLEFFKKIINNNEKYYEGKFGKGNTNSKIKIRSQFGGVSIKENN